MDGARGVSGIRVYPGAGRRRIVRRADRVPDSVAIVEALYPYIERELSTAPISAHITRHILGLFQGVRARASGVAT